MSCECSSNNGGGCQSDPSAGEATGTRSLPMAGEKRSLPMAGSTATLASDSDGLFEAWSDLIAYPRDGYLEALRSVGARIEEQHPEALLFLATFTRRVKKLSLHELEELYTRTFDMDPVVSLDLGWHLYGETYERGRNLVQMRAMLRHYGVEETGELPDHMTHALRLLERMQMKDRCIFLVDRILPAMVKIVEGFEGRESIYHELVLALQAFLRSEIAGEELPAKTEEAELKTAQDYFSGPQKGAFSV